METALFIIQTIGSVSFALTGTIIAIQKKTDFVGAVFFALLTAFGGGIIRDLVLNHTPRVFVDRELYVTAAVCAVLALICFHLAFFKPVAKFIGAHQHNLVLELTDALGLSTFCVLGVDLARGVAGESATTVLLIFCGLITGVGGGMLRDICSAQIPSVFRKNIYLIPAVLGSALYVLTYAHWNRLASMLLSIALIIVIRLLAYFFKWNLPVHKNEIE